MPTVPRKLGDSGGGDRRLMPVFAAIAERDEAAGLSSTTQTVSRSETLDGEDASGQTQTLCLILLAAPRAIRIVS